MDQSSVLFVGTGKLLTPLCARLAVHDWRITALRRQTHLLPETVTPFKADITQAATLTTLAENTYDYIVFTLTPSISTEAGYRDTYLTGLHNVLSALTRNDSLRKTKHIFFASSVSIYPNLLGEWVDECSPVSPDVFNGQVMHEAEQLILSYGVPATNIRFGGIYGGSRNRLIQDVRTGHCSPRDYSWSNRIHEDDAINVLHHLLQLAKQSQPLPNCLNAVDNAPTPLYRVKNWLAKQTHSAYTWPTPTDQVINGKRCDNKRLLSLGFQFTYADYKAGYTAILQSLSSSPDDNASAPNPP